MIRNLCFALVAYALTGAAVAEDRFLFCYDPYPPYTLGDSGTPSGGLKVKLIHEVFERVNGATAEVILLPWKQCQLQAKTGKVDGILPLFKNDERAEYLVFSESTFDQMSVLWYKPSRFPDGIPWDTFEDLAHLKLGMITGAFIDEEMEQVFSKNKGIHRGKNVKNLFELLLKERVDLVAVDLGVGNYVRKENDWVNEIASLRKTIGLKSSYFGLAKSSKVPDRLDDINAAIRSLRDDGTIKAIETSTDYTVK